MIRALRLGHRDAVDVLVDRGIQIGFGELAGAVDAHDYVAAATSLRAAPFSDAGTLSSRSSWMQSAPRVCALSTYFSTFTGTYMSERQTGRSSFIPLRSWPRRRLRRRCRRLP